MIKATHAGARLAPSRRDFLRTTTAAAFGSAVITQFGVIPGAYAAGGDAIKVGVIGCGGRGTGAIKDVLTAAAGVRIVALGDLFKDRVDEARTKINELSHDPEIKQLGNSIELTDDRCFTGFDAYAKVIAQPDVNYVILATPPGFRPTHIKAAVAAGKHIFTEKPVAVDGTGIRACLAAYEEAKAKGLGVAAGTQRRHDVGYNEAMQRLRDGAIGEIVAGRAYWNQGAIWHKERQPGWSDVEWQIRNWNYFTWLSGDHIVEQHVHNMDVANWALGAHPVRAVGMGGRQARTEPVYGHIFDHFAVDYEYENGVHVMSMCRQIPGTTGNVSEALVGTKGTYASKGHTITGPHAWRYTGKPPSPYVLEHTNLINSIRAGKPINELKQVAESTLTMIMGRMSAYTGKAVTWEQALNSKEDLVPATLSWGPRPMPAVAIPGQTQLI